MGSLGPPCNLLRRSRCRISPRITATIASSCRMPLSCRPPATKCRSRSPGAASAEPICMFFHGAMDQRVGSNRIMGHECHLGRELLPPCLPDAKRDAATRRSRSVACGYQPSLVPPQGVMQDLPIHASLLPSCAQKGVQDHHLSSLSFCALRYVDSGSGRIDGSGR